jgi:hypothetical protein
MAVDAYAQENLDSYMIGLACKLRNLAQDILHFATYDGSDVDSSESQYRKYMKDAVNFMSGAHLCERYLYGSIGLDEFCAEMVEEKLKEFLKEIPHLPHELVIKYGLVPVSDTNDVDTNDVEASGNDVKMECDQ